MGSEMNLSIFVDKPSEMTLLLYKFFLAVSCNQDKYDLHTFYQILTLSFLNKDRFDIVYIYCKRPQRFFTSNNNNI